MFLKESAVVAPEGSNWEIDVSKSKSRCRSTKNDCGATCWFDPWWSTRAERKRIVDRARLPDPRFGDGGGVGRHLQPRFFSTAPARVPDRQIHRFAAGGGERAAHRIPRRSGSARSVGIFKGVIIRYIIDIRARETPQRLHPAPQEPGTLPPFERFDYNWTNKKWIGGLRCRNRL